VKIALPSIESRSLKGELRADEKPATPDDPRSRIANDVFGPYGA
jgi:hypothetical protein